MIGSIGSYSTTQAGGAAAFKAASATERVSDASENQGASGTQGGTQTISTLARQLAASASRAEERDKTLTRSELADKAKSIMGYCAQFTDKFHENYFSSIIHIDSGLEHNGTKNQRKRLPSPFSPFLPCICINIAIT